MPLVCEDEATFIFDSRSRRVWVTKGNKPRRTVTGSHQKIHVFGFLAEDGRRVFKQSQELNTHATLQSLYLLKQRIGKCILVIDRAPWHKAKKVQTYLEKNKNIIKFVFLPRGCPEMNPVEECWRQAKQEVNGGRIHESFEAMTGELRNFLKHRKFNQDMDNYLRP